MSSLKGLGWRDVSRALKISGFIEAPHRGKGSHLAFIRVDTDNRRWLVVIPRVKDIPIGTIHAIIKQAGLTIQQFLEQLIT